MFEVLAHCSHLGKAGQRSVGIIRMQDDGLAFVLSVIDLGDGLCENACHSDD